MNTTKLRKRGSYYYVRVPTPSGKSKLVSTGQTDREQAISTVKESGVLGIASVAKVSSLTTRAVNQILTGRKITIQKSIEPFASCLRIRGSKKHAENIVATLHEWVAKCGVGNLAPSSITPDQISKFINDESSKAKASTRRVKLSHFRTFFDYLVDVGWCLNQPANQVGVNYDILTHDQKEKREMLPYTREEIDALITGIRSKMEAVISETIVDMAKLQRLEFWLAAVMIASNTGLRIGDVCWLEWASFKTPGVVVVNTRKTVKRVTPEVPEEIDILVSNLEKHKRDERFMFPDHQAIDSNPKTKPKLSVWFSRLCQSIGVPSRGFHSIRRGFATDRFKQGDGLEKIAAVLGHSNTKTTEGYIR